MKNLMFNALRKIVSPLFGKGYGNLPLIAPAAAWWKRVYRPEHVMIEGNRLYLNPKDTGFSSLSAYLATHSYYEKTETDLLRRYVQPGMSVLDLGANIGYFTVLMSALVGRNGRVIAVEPDTTNLMFLERTVSELKFDNVEIVKAAAWDTSGVLDLYVSRVNPGDHRTFPSDEDRTHYAIPCVAIDDLPGDLMFDIVKMDIQGAEGHALNGMKQTFVRRLPNIILTEFWPSMLAVAGTPPESVFNTLLAWGYTITLIRDDQLQPQPITFAEIDQLCDLDWKFFNLLCVRDGAEVSP